MDISIQRLKTEDEDVYILKKCASSNWKQCNKYWNTTIHLENDGPNIKVPLIFWFLIMTWNLCFHIQLWVKCTHMGNSSRHIRQTIHDSRNLYGYLTLNKMHIELASLIICLIKYNLTNTSSIPLLKVRSIIINRKFNNFVYIKRNFTFIENLRIKP